MMVDICNDLKEKESRLRKLKKIKEDVSEILNMGDVSDEIVFERASPQNQLL